LSDLVFGKSVEVVGDKIDKHGRLVGKILLEGRDINLQQVKDGFAWHYKQYESEQSESDRKAYADAEIAARTSKSNLWSIANPIAPWDFRAGAAIGPELRDKIFGNKNSMLYHWNACPGFAKIAVKNRVVFETWEEAEEAGYKVAQNCPAEKPEGTLTEAEKLILDSFADESAKTDTKAAPPQAERANPNAASATAICRNGEYSYERIPSLACKNAEGVDRWLYSGSASPVTSAPTERPVYESRSPSYSPPPVYVPSYPSYTPSSSRTVRPPDGAPKTVHVRGYHRKNGTYVAPHSRRAPKR
jgi:hypothetical protein